MTDDTPPSAARAMWNLIVTSRESGQRRLRRALRPIVRLQGSGFRNVFVARVDDVEGCLMAVAELCERRPRLDSWLGRILPIERTFAVDPGAFDAQLRVEAVPFVDRLAGRGFHVRVERRGHKGVINTHASEHFYDTLNARGQAATVQFADPDVVLAVEVLGDTAGLGLVTRALRERFPFVKIN